MRPNAWHSRPVLPKATLLLLLFIAAYWTPLRGTAGVWFTNGDYSYGPFIPLISAYFIWEKRRQLQHVDIRGYWPALPLLLICVSLSLYGILGSSGNISRPAIPIAIILFTAFCFGKEVTRELFFPLIFLIFMVPPPAFLERTLGLHLKSVSSKLGGGLIKLCDIPVHVNGNTIDLGVTQLEVIDACNGIRYLFPLMAIGCVYVAFFEKAMWKKVVCVLATIPIAVFINGFRIGLTGLLMNHFGISVAEGFAHDFAGWAVFLASFILLFLLSRILALFPPKKDQPAPPNAQPPPEATRGSVTDINQPFQVSVLVLLTMGALNWSTTALPPMNLRGGIASAPLEFAGWHGFPTPLDPETIEKSGAEESFLANYHNGRNETASLYIGYRSTAFLENENFFHSPTACLPSSGWNTITASTREITAVPAIGNLTVTAMVVENMGATLIVYYWFQTKNRSTADKDINRLHLTLHALKRDNTYDLFIRPIMHVMPGERIDDAKKRMDQFVREMTAALVPFLKKNVES